MSQDDEFDTDIENKSPYYLIVDNFAEFLAEHGGMISTEGLRGCRSEAEALATAGCAREPELGRRSTLQVREKVRCDALVWLNEHLQ